MPKCGCEIFQNVYKILSLMWKELPKWPDCKSEKKDEMLNCETESTDWLDVRKVEIVALSLQK